MSILPNEHGFGDVREEGMPITPPENLSQRDITKLFEKEEKSAKLLGLLHTPVYDRKVMYSVEQLRKLGARPVCQQYPVGLDSSFAVRDIDVFNRQKLNRSNLEGRNSSKNNPNSSLPREPNLNRRDLRPTTLHGENLSLSPPLRESFDQPADEDLWDMPSTKNSAPNLSSLSNNAMEMERLRRVQNQRHHTFVPFDFGGGNDVNDRALNATHVNDRIGSANSANALNPFRKTSKVDAYKLKEASLWSSSEDESPVAKVSANKTNSKSSNSPANKNAKSANTPANRGEHTPANKISATIHPKEHSTSAQSQHLLNLLRVKANNNPQSAPVPAPAPLLSSPSPVSHLSSPAPAPLLSSPSPSPSPSTAPIPPHSAPYHPGPHAPMPHMIPPHPMYNPGQGPHPMYPNPPHPHVLPHGLPNTFYPGPMPSPHPMGGAMPPFQGSYGPGAPGGVPPHFMASPGYGPPMGVSFPPAGPGYLVRPAGDGPQYMGGENSGNLMPGAPSQIHQNIAASKFSNSDDNAKKIEKGKALLSLLKKKSSPVSGGMSSGSGNFPLLAANANNANNYNHLASPPHTGNPSGFISPPNMNLKN